MSDPDPPEESEGTPIDEIPELLAITQGIADDLKQKFSHLRVIRDGRLQITLFDPMNFRNAQVVVSVKGVFVVDGNSRFSVVGMTGDEIVTPGVEGFFGPYPLESPTMLKDLHQALAKWQKPTPT